MSEERTLYHVSGVKRQCGQCGDLYDDGFYHVCSVIGTQKAVSTMQNIEQDLNDNLHQLLLVGKALKIK